VDDGLMEILGSAEQDALNEEQFSELLRLAKQGIGRLVSLQRKAVMGEFTWK
jgi:ribonuclease PH